MRASDSLSAEAGIKARAPGCSAANRGLAAQATKDAAAIAQLRVGKLVKEPVAAVLAFKCTRCREEPT